MIVVLNDNEMSIDKNVGAMSEYLSHIRIMPQYNKAKKYTLILTKQGDNILYADKSYDITNDVIAGLNKAYKPSKAAKEEKK